MRTVYNPPMWGRLSAEEQGLWGSAAKYDSMFPHTVSYRTAMTKGMTKEQRRKAAAAGAAAYHEIRSAAIVARRNKKKSAKKASSKGKGKRGTVKLVAVTSTPASSRRRDAKGHFVKGKGKRATKRNPANPAIVRFAEQKASRVPVVGPYLGSAAGAAVFAAGGSLAVWYFGKWFTTWKFLLESEYSWLNKVAEPKFAFPIAGILLGIAARLLTPGDATTKRAAQIAVTTAGFGFGMAYYYTEESTTLLEQQVAADRANAAA